MENTSQASANYKALFYGLLTFLLMVGSFFAGVYYTNNSASYPKAEKTKVELKITPKISVEKSPSPTTKTAISKKPEATITTGQNQYLAAIKWAMAAKYSKNPEDVTITVSDYEPSFAKGGVTFAGEMGGGWFLAAEVGGEWVIVQDGNGTVTCEVIEPYNFPVSMVSECWSENTQELIYR